MEKIEIEGELDRSWIISLISEGFDTYQILKNYNITEELIVDCSDLFVKEVLLEGFNFSEVFIRVNLESEYFSESDLYNMNMNTYSNFSAEFIKEYSNFLNWNRFIVYLTTQTNNFTNYISMIEEKQLWNLISANDLSIDFIRLYKDKLCWEILSITKFFTEDEKTEFSEYFIENKVINSNSEELILDLTPNVERDYSIDEIADLIDRYMYDNNKDFYIKIK